MSVLILRDDLRDLARRSGVTGPRENIGEGVKLSKLGRQLAAKLGWHAADGDQGNRSHIEAYDPRDARIRDGA